MDTRTGLVSTVGAHPMRKTGLAACVLTLSSIRVHPCLSLSWHRFSLSLLLVASWPLSGYLRLAEDLSFATYLLLSQVASSHPEGHASDGSILCVLPLYCFPHSALCMLVLFASPRPLASATNQVGMSSPFSIHCVSLAKPRVSSRACMPTPCHDRRLPAHSASASASSSTPLASWRAT